MDKQKILVPDMGDFKDVEIIEVLVKEGQVIKKNDSLITLESDKSSVEVPSTLEGMVANINVKIGDKVSKGDVLIMVSGEQTKTNGDEIKSSKDKFPTDTENEISRVQGVCKELGVNAILAEHWKDGGKGASKLAETVVDTIENKTSNLKFTYADEDQPKDKITKISNLHRIQNLT